MIEGEKKRSFFTVGRLFDVLAVLAILFVVYRLFVAPRIFNHAATAFPAPHVVYQRLDGSSFQLAQQKGHVVFLDFFASWCEPCRLEMPLVEHFAKTHPEVELVSVDVGEPRGIAANFAEKFHLGNIAMDPAASAQGYFSIEGFPTIVVVDPENRIRASWAGFNPAIELAMSNAEKQLR